MIAIVPTVLGGVWQLFMLGSISSNMIRFFSISQLISDGLLVLGFFILPISIVYPIIKNRNKEKIDPLPTSKTENVLIISSLICIIVLMAILLSDIKILIQLKDFNSLKGLLMIVCVFNAIIYTSFRKFIHERLTIELFIIIIILINFIITTVAFYKVSKDISGIKNIEILISNIEKEDCYSKVPDILYFNDKYIFIQLEKRNKKSILIKKFDDLFE
nr:hypothetical protein [uncultured Flavobacterium sp.]